MAIAVILADMPDLWQRLLVEHVPDRNGRCWECRDSAGSAAKWPCVTRQIAEQAEALYEGRRQGGANVRVPVPRRGPTNWSRPMR